MNEPFEVTILQTDIVYSGDPFQSDRKGFLLLFKLQTYEVYLLFITAWDFFRYIFSFLWSVDLELVIVFFVYLKFCRIRNHEKDNVSIYYSAKKLAFSISLLKNNF